MRNQNVEWDESYDYAPNELNELHINNPRLYREIVESNLEPGDSLENWQQRNLKRMQDFLQHQLIEHR
jgi:hypothetical protein